MGVICPKCDSRQTRVLDTRPEFLYPDNRIRKQVCDQCEKKFMTRKDSSDTVRHILGVAVNVYPPFGWSDPKSRTGQRYYVAKEKSHNLISGLRQAAALDDLSEGTPEHEEEFNDKDKWLYKTFKQ